MTTIILSENTHLILKDGTLVTLEEDFDMIWFHPTGKMYGKGSYRLNLKHKLIDVHNP